MLIYKPKGRAEEYSPLALSIYEGECDHGCHYCYMRELAKRFPRFAGPCRPRPDFIARLRRELERGAAREALPSEQVLLSFTGDPYCHAEEEYRQTRGALELLCEYGAPVSILTKGGPRCLRDLDLFKQFKAIKVGASLTLATIGYSDRWEPGAASPAERLDSLESLHSRGIQTWASLEPVIDPGEALYLIRLSERYVDQFMVGKWNHDGRAWAIDWPKFAREAVELLRGLGKPFYIKANLRAHLPEDFLTAAESDPRAQDVKGGVQ